MSKQLIPPAQLWVGKHTTLTTETNHFLQSIFCSQNGCNICKICKKINNKQHHGAIWINTEKYYTLEDITIIFDTIAFQLNEHEKLFFIIQNADFLTESCSNKLLKSVEEPPTGYHFIFLSECPSKILPTIQSRCTIKYFHSATHVTTESPLLILFKSPNSAPSNFLKLLVEEKPHEKHSIEMLDQLLKYWIEKSKIAIEQNREADYKKAQQIIVKLKNSLSRPPMPGSSKIFLRNLYLQCNF